jgi:hypothetical protein
MINKFDVKNLIFILVAKRRVQKTVPHLAVVRGYDQQTAGVRLRPQHCCTRTYSS